MHATAGCTDLMVLVHGLGGSAESTYMRRAATVGVKAGFDVLRLNLRGAGGQGSDIYHGGLSDDLAAVVAAPDLVAYQRVVFLGFSLGGHLALRLATHVSDARVRAVAAVCSPLHLGAGQQAIDRRSAWLYRRYVLSGLKASFARVATGETWAEARPAVRRVTTILDFDRHTVVPRFGFADPADYYDRASVGPRLNALRVSSLLVAARHDPMVPASTIEPWLGYDTTGRLDVRWQASGGHVGMPPTIRLESTFDGNGVEAQAVAWLRARLEA